MTTPKTEKLTIMALISGFIFLSGILNAQPQSDLGMGMGHHPVFQQLTEVQRTELHEFIADLHNQGLSREEIHKQVQAKVSDWGIELPAPATGKYRHIENTPELTEVQHDRIKALKDSLRAQGADRKAAHETIQAQFEAWGIEPPVYAGRHHQGFGFIDQLSEDQKTALNNLREQKKTEGATRQQIHEAINAQLDVWGLELPPLPEGPEKGKHQRHGFLMNLNEDQRNELRILREAMKDQGASREDIHSAIREKLESWGIQHPNEKQDSGQSLGKQHRHGEISNRPNPFNPSTTITYTLKEPGLVNVSIFNTQGQCIRTLLNASQQAGSIEITWDGMNDSGNTVPSGTYICKIATSSGTISKRMQMLK